MAANVINFVSSLIYGDVGTAELGAPPAGTKNHLVWTRDFVVTPPPASTRGVVFLTHHLDVMLARYESWRSLNVLPPVRPWEFVPSTLGGPSDNPNLFPGHYAMSPLGPALPANLRTFPPAWTTNDLGNAVLTYYNSLRNYLSPGAFDGTEMTDELKAPYSYRYWSFMKWVSDQRKRLLGQPVLPVATMYDRDGTVLSEKEFTDIFHQVHHVWHPNTGPPTSWTEATPYFRTAVGQHRRKKQASRTQIGAEFFAFHRDHLELFDRWLARTGQDPVQAINTCAHDVGFNPQPPPGIDTVWSPSGQGHPIVNWTVDPPTADFNPTHVHYWDGDLSEMASLGEMGQFFATDNTIGSLIPVAGASDSGYHGIGHMLNGDLLEAVANNHVPRFFAWHGYIDDLWAKREPRFVTFAPVQADGSAFGDPAVLTILRDLTASTDVVEPTGAIGALSLATGHGTLRVRIRVRPDPFGRPLELSLRCEVLREASGPTPVIELSRTLTATVGPAAGPSERQQGVDFVEDFVFDGSAGTTDGAGRGPFAKDNPVFAPTAVGFVNSAIRITGTLATPRRPDGTIPATPGTLSSAGTTVSGAGTTFNTTFRRGDLIRAAGQVRAVGSIAGNTTLTVDEAFVPALLAATAYERLDGFVHEKIVEIPLVQEKLAPSVTSYLNRSTFSKDQVAPGGAVFADAFYVLLQDRTERPAPIPWPADVDPRLYGLIAPPARAAGIYPDLAHAPVVELVDEATNVVVAGITVTATSVAHEDPALHPSVPQRVTYTCQAAFANDAMFAGMMAGDRKSLKLRVTATDRSGNRTVDESARVLLQVSPNPYMLDGPTPWLSVDTRVFQIRQGQARFGVAAGWTDPHVFIQQVVANFRAGNGVAGGESYTSLPEDQATSVLEYSTQVGGQNVHNFALARMWLKSAAGAAGVRTTFRLLRWGTANVSFDSALTYRTAPSGVGLLGRTTGGELASIPFFAEPRMATMTAQTDSTNTFDFLPTGGAEVSSYYGAYLDINQSTPRFPDTFAGDGPFSGTLSSIRDLVVSQHQCMVVEVVFPGDPTPPGATPSSSDNLAQRNLLVVQTANPGNVATRVVQHSFDIDVTHCNCPPGTWKPEPAEREPEPAERKPVEPLRGHHDHDDHDHHDQNGHGEEPDRDVHEHVFTEQPQPVRPAWMFESQPGAHREHGEMDHLSTGWIAEFPDVLAQRRREGAEQSADRSRWTLDPDAWKGTDGLDELVFFWNDLPQESQVDLWLPGVDVAEIFNYRSLRHAPGTVGVVDAETLRLRVGGPTFVPIPPYFGDNIAGLVTVVLPPGIRKGQEFAVDVIQARGDTHTVFGGFRLLVKVDDAENLIEPETRALELMHQRLSVLPKDSRWRRILEAQVGLFRERAAGFADLAGIDAGWDDPTHQQRGQKVRVVLESIEVMDDRDPFPFGAGELRFRTRVVSPDNGGQEKKTLIPEAGHVRVDDSGDNVIELGTVLFEGWVEDRLGLEIGGVELDVLTPDDRLCSYRRTFSGSPESWFGSYGATDEAIDPENVEGWRPRYRIERG